MPTITGIIDGKHWTPHGFGTSVGLTLTNGASVWGDCVGCRELPEFSVLESTNLADWVVLNQHGADAAYGLMQAVSHYLSQIKETDTVAVLADYFERDIGDAPKSLYGGELGERGVGVHYVSKVAQGFEMALSPRHIFAQIGEDGALLKKRVAAICSRLEDEPPMSVHVNLRGAYTEAFGSVLRRLVGLAGAASPHEVFVENVIKGDEGDWERILEFMRLRKEAVYLGATVRDGRVPSENLNFGVLTRESYGRLDVLKKIIQRYPEMRWFVRGGTAETHRSLTYLLDLACAINASGIFLQNDHQLSIAYNHLQKS